MNAAIRWMVIVLCCAGLLATGQPNATAYAQNQACFTETTQCISGRIRSFWEQNGGLMTFGYPITDQHIESIEGKPTQVQWFERARLELHPENAAPYDVLLGRLGVERLAQQGRDWTTFPKSPNEVRNDCTYYDVTGHFVCAAMRFGWASRGLEIDGVPGYNSNESLALLGLPLDDAHTEQIEGRSFLVQWFERGRLEFHPENNPPYNILGGLLGSEVRANLPPAPSTAPTGHLIFLAADGATIMRANPDGSAAQPLFTIAKAANEEVANLSADASGSAILFGIYGADGLRYDLMKDGAVRHLGAFASQPRWSPDGKRIALQAYQNGATFVYDIATDRKIEMPFHGTADWSADSDMLVYVERPQLGAGSIAANISVYSMRAQFARRLTTLPESGPDIWTIQEAHVLPGSQQIIFYGGQPKNLGASGNGQQWWWVPIAGGAPQRFSDPGGNGVGAYGLSSTGEWIAYSTQMHGSVCISEGTVTLHTADTRGGVAVDAPLRNSNADGYTLVHGLAWEPNGNYLAIGAQSYRCSNSSAGRQLDQSAIYVWKIRLIGTNGATFVKIADGTFPVWVS